ncbi:ParB family protein (plasmid) [Calothrix sp. NIES-4071]|nr:ParB family protein [Calothrix sp. NIES-4071]BAZ64357.1 ParB family protein [Calothrix sp. NIES-4105]
MKRTLETMSNLDTLFGSNIEEAPTNLIPLTSIVRPKTQPRRYFDEEKIQSLAESISDVGLLEPIVVRKLENGTYELVAGERRLRACQNLQKQEVPVNIIECNETQANHIRLIENLQREDLNTYEETTGILELLTILLKKEETEIIKLLHVMHDADKGKTPQNVLGNPESQVIQDLFKKLGKITWQSFLTARVPILKLQGDIKEALAKGEIEYTKALAISKIKNDTARTEVLQQAIDEKLSLSKIKELVEKSVTKESVPKVPTYQPKDVTIRFGKVNKLLKDTDIWDRPQQANQLVKYLGQIEKLLMSASNTDV